MTAPVAGERIEALIGRSCCAHPERVVAIAGAGRLTFGELDELSSALAGRLLRHGVSRGDYVVVSTERDHQALVSILAVLKAGAAFIPVELPQPRSRIAAVAALDEVTCVVTDLASAPAWEQAGKTLVLVSLEGLRERAGGEGAPPHDASADDAAYAIATSGSTGAPKTVAVAHRPLVSLVDWIGRRFEIGPRDRGLWISPGSFDLSMFDLLGLPALGASVRMVPDAARADPGACAEILANEEITFWNSTPGVLQSVLPFVRGAPANRSATSMRVAFVSGDWVPLTLHDELRETFGGCQLIALGGATEATIWSNFHHVREIDPSWTSVPYGRPIPSATYHVCDEAGAQCAAGERGELFIGGDCLALGYLGDAELTRARFPADLFSSAPGARMYRTGDAARRWADGTIELLGRIDEQVSVSGYRVELGEVESALRGAGLASATAVALPGVAGSHRIAAAGVPAAPSMSVESVLGRLREVLPAYMIPTPLMLLKQQPLTVNGKADRRAVGELLAAAPLERPAEPTAGGGSVEAVLRREITAVAGPGIDGFGADQPLGELGVSSLGVAVLSGRVFDELGVRVSPVDFYEDKTLRRMTARIGRMLSTAQDAGAVASAAPAVRARDARPDGDAIAVVGLSCRMPGADDAAQLWDRLVGGDVCIGPFPARRSAGCADRGAGMAPGGYLEDVEGFDARLFGITPREAGHMDPRQRLVLEAVWTAIEDAGESPDALRGRRVGMFVGATGDDFARASYRDPEAIHGHTLTGLAPSIIANRVSYCLDLRGPSEVVDTACSSSLVALHRALSALAQGDCDAALVAGVSLVLDAGTTLALQRLGMLSPDGRCRTFDAAANGYGRGEGVGVVYLKPLDRARSERCRVYCRVLSTAVNQAGRTASLTAPSPESQRDVLLTAYRRADIDPRTVGMVEAHGTGTRLGDPVETRALVQAFGDLYRDRDLAANGAHCALTAVKTNVGHLEAASGIAGLLKTALALHRGVVPPLASLGEVNELLELARSPFFLCTEACDWPVAVDEHPRRAGVSSFGFGGANVHAVLEAVEAAEDASCARADSDGPYLIALSALEGAALRRHAQAFVRYLDRELEAEPARRDALAEISRTTLVGRPALAVRLACVTESVAGARDALTAFVDGEADTSGALAGCGYGATWNADGSGGRRGSLRELARRWAGGERIDWARSEACPAIGDVRRPASLPGYPFDREPRVPAPSPEGSEDISLAEHAEAIQAHRIDGRALIPAAVLLGLYQELYHRLTGSWAVRVEHVRFLANSSAATAPASLHISWVRTDDGWRATLGEQGVAYSTARLVEAPAGDLHGLAPDPGESPEAAAHALSADACYDRLLDAGVAIGAKLRCLARVIVTADACLADIRGTAGPAADAAGSDPALVDGALQAALLWRLETKPAGPPPLPVSIDAVTFYGRLRGDCAAGLSRAPSEHPGTGASSVTCATLYAPGGAPCARLEGLAAATRGEPVPAGEPRDTEVHLFARAMRELPRTREKSAPQASATRALVLGGPELATALGACGLDVVDARHRADPGGTRSIEGTGAETSAAVERFLAQASGETGPVVVIAAGATTWRVDAEAIVAAARAVARDGASVAARIVVAYGLAASDRCAAALGPAVGALARTLRLEGAAVRLCAVAAEADRGCEPLAAAVVHVLEHGPQTGDARFDVARGTLSVPVAVPISPPGRAACAATLRRGGSYVISGGLGGVGLVLARELLTRREATLVLCGRTAADDPTVRSRLQALRGIGGEVDYVAADVRDEAGASRLASRARVSAGAIHGVIHCAGVLRDGLLAGSSTRHAFDVIEPKVLGAIHLDRATRSDELDFFAVFSSLVTTVGNPGQSAYAFANGWLEGFAELREAARRDAACSGRTVAIGWGPWQVDGMRLTKQRRARLARRHGLAELDATGGFATLTRALALDEPVTVAAAGDGTRLAKWLDASLEDGPAPGGNGGPVPDGSRTGPPSAAAHARELVRSAIAEECGLRPEEIDPAARFEEYGLDSALIVATTTRLEDVLGDLPMTLFFDHRTLDEVAARLAATHADALDERVAAAGATPASPEHEDPLAPPSAPPPTSSPRTVMTIHTDRTPGSRDIAVIGMDGMFPEAADLARFWRNLAEGRDCVQRLPGDRWSHPASNNGNHSQWGGFVADWNRFDHAFFSISPTEAQMMDPQERLFLQCVYHALEDAGYPGAALAGEPVGVYAGVMWGQYQLYGAGDGSAATSYGSIAHRVSHFFDLTGPSIALDTMCSSSLTALHLACESLRRGETRAAIVGGVNVDVHPAKHQFLVRRHFASADGTCRAFGEGGDGYVPGDGVAVVVLKPLSAAQRDGDRIHGVIKGSAINHGGRARGFTVPSPAAQAQVIRAALDDAAVAPSTIGYVETHGTGTALGDPIEVRALTDALGPDATPCPIGSVKANIGHLESAAGVASLIKVLLQMRHRVLAPSIHALPPNKHIDFHAASVYVQTELDHWLAPLARDGDALRVGPRRAGVSSFGAGGANAHVIIEEPPSAPATTARHDDKLVVALSALDDARLADHARALLDWLRAEDADGPPAPDVPRLHDALVRRIADAAARDSRSIEPRDSLASLGLGSDAARELADALGRSLGAGGSGDITEQSSIADLAGIVSDRAVRAGRGPSIADISYTSLVAREAMSARVAVLARDIDELERGLQAYLDARPSEQVMRRSGRARAEADAARVADGVRRRDHRALAELWCGGTDVDWRALFAGSRPRLTDQPRYPFARTRCWVQTPGLPGIGDKTAPASALRRAEYEVVVGAQTSATRRAAALVASLTTLSRFRQASYELEDLRVRCDGSPAGAVGVQIAYKAGGGALTMTALGADEEPWLTASIPAVGGAAGRQAAAHAPAGDEEEVASGSLLLRVTSTRDAITATFERSSDTSAGGLVDVLAFLLERARRLSAVTGIRALTAHALSITGAVGARGTLSASRCEDGSISCAARGDLDLDIDGLRVEGEPVTRPASRPSLARIAYEVVYHPAGSDHAPLRARSGSLPAVVAFTSEPAPGVAPDRMLRVGDGDGISKLVSALAAVEDCDTIVLLPPASGDPQPAVATLCRLAGFLGDPSHAFRRLVVVTEAAHAPDPDERMDPGSALFLGLARAAARELRSVDVHILDVAVGERAALALGSPGDIPISDAPAEQVLRGGRLYERGIRRAEHVSALPLCYRDGGTYVLVGGSGVVGRQVTNYLVSRHDARVAWIGRRDEDAVVRDLGLAKLPTGVSYHRADVCDAEALRGALDAVETVSGGVDGVVGLVMEFDFRRLADATPADARRCIRAKADGTQVLLRALRGRDPGFLCLMSSAEVLTGNPGWGLYAGACAFQDALALDAARRSRFPIRVVNWGYWEGNDRVKRETLVAKGIAPLPVETCMDAISAAVHGEQPQLVVLDVAADLLRRMGFDAPVSPAQAGPVAEAPAPRPLRAPPAPRPEPGPAPRKPGAEAPVVAQKAAEAPVVAHAAAQEAAEAPVVAHAAAQEAAEAPVVGPAAPPQVAVVGAEAPDGSVVDIPAVLARVLASTLGISAGDIDPDTDIAEYGLDSILFLDFAEDIEKELGPVPVDELIALDTLREIERHVAAVRSAPASPATVSAPPEPPSQPSQASAAVGASNGHPDEAAAPASGMLKRALLRYLEGFENGAAADATRDGLRCEVVGPPRAVAVEVLSSGSGPTVLLIPGIGLTAPIFHAQFESLRSDWRLVAIHSPGHGRSAPPAAATTETLATTIEDTLGLLAADQPVHVVASCFSTVVAQYIAAKRPHLVASLTLCGAAAEGIAIPKIPEAGLSARDVAELTEAAAQSLIADFDAVLAAPENAPVRHHVRESCELLLASQKASPAVGMRYLNEVLSLRPSEWAADIDAPTLFVVGALDTIVSPEATMETAARFRDARIMEIPTAGHYAFLTHPAAFNAGLTDFLTSLM